MSERTMFAAGRIVPDVEAALRGSAYGSSTSGERAIWRMGFADALAGHDDRARINVRWRPCYDSGHAAGANAMRVPDHVTDTQPE